jgi:hypothetical protein
MLQFLRETAIVFDSALRYLFWRLVKGAGRERALKSWNDGIDRLIR